MATDDNDAHQENADTCAKLEAKTSLFREFANALPGVACIYDIFQDGSRKLIFLGQGLAEIAGPKTVEYIGENVDRFFEMVHPDDVASFQRAANESVIAGVHFDHEYRMETDSGYHWVRSFGKASEIGRGTFRWSSLLLDISTKKKMEARIQSSIDAKFHSEANYKDLVENLQDGIGIVDLDENFVFANSAAERIFGSPTGGLLGRSLYEFTSEENQKLIQDQTKSRYNSFNNTYELEILRKDGTKRHLMVSATPRLDDQGKLEGVLGIFKDTTEFKNLENQFIQAQKMEAIGRLAGGVAHDFNNLLSVIIINADLGKLVVDKDSALDENLTEISETAQRAAKLTKQLLAFSRKQVINPRRIFLNETISDMTKMLKRIIGDDLVFTFIHDPKTKPIWADESQIEQIMVNLAVNARDAMPDGGNLTIETKNVHLKEDFTRENPGSKEGSFVLMSISDNGHGMSKELLSKSFEPFFTTKPEGKGTGLGLSTVYGIVKQNDGYVKVFSEEGRGTTFSIYFPETSNDSSTDTEKREKSYTVNGHGVVLVIEDNPAVLRTVSRSLSQSGYKVLTALNPAEARHLCKTSRLEFDLILSDVIMPEVDGPMLINELQKLQPQALVLFMSGYPKDAITKHGVFDKNINFIAKPFTQKDLVEKVKELIGRVS